MSMNYKVESLYEEMQKDMEEKKVLIEAWKGVTIVTKKDGKPFRSMQKNFSGATYKQRVCALQGYEKELSVCVCTKSCGYVTDKINCYSLVGCDKEMAERKPENVMPKKSYFEQIYLYDIEDIKEEIEKRIAYLEKSLAELEADLAVFEEVAKEVENKLKEAKDYCKGKMQSYFVRDLLKTIFDDIYYC